MPFKWPPLAGCAASKLLWDEAIVNLCPDTEGDSYLGVLRIDYDQIPGPGVKSGETPAGVLRHELGHLLGFRHEHAFAPEESRCGIEGPDDAAKDLTGRELTEFDTSSVMHYHDICNGEQYADFTLSKLDGEGARAVYGMPAAWYVPVLF